MKSILSNEKRQILFASGRLVEFMVCSYITDEQVVKREQEAARLELEKCRALDVPITVYDRE